MEQYRYRNLARIVIETITPLAVGSGEKDMITDSVVARDVNGLPYIPGTAIVGIIRHELGIKKFDKSIFGFKESGEDKKERIKREKEADPYSEAKENIDTGSEIIFSSAQIVDENGKVIEGFIDEKSDYLKNFDELPVRQHVRINGRGTAEKHGKFNEEVVYKGTRFCFEIELLSKTDNNNFQTVLNELAKDTIRIGGGTRKGFGEIKIVECKHLNYDLSDKNKLNDYIEKTSSLNDEIWESHENQQNPINQSSDNWTEYRLELTPDDFFLFGSGFGDDNADMVPVSESYFDWSSGKPERKEDTVLIPGSSVKGALSHRVAFHYNQIKKYFVGNSDAKTGDENPAVRTLFGYTSQDKKEVICGNVLISDVIQVKNTEKSKILNHVSIDRFTRGAIDSALFSEKVIYGNGEKYMLTFNVNSNAIGENDIKKAFEDALRDIVHGMLPLGGGTYRGHGCFSGKIYKNN